MDWIIWIIGADFDEVKEKNRKLFTRRGGTCRSKPNGGTCRGHRGAADHSSGMNKDSKKDHAECIERQAARQGAIEE